LREQINIIETLRLFLRHWWKIAISAVLGALLFFLVSAYAMTPVYTSRGSLYVNNSNTMASQNVTLSDLATSQQLAYTYIELLSSDTFMAQVLEYCQLPYTAAQVKGMLYMVPLNETEIIEIRATSYYPAHAQTVVDAVLKNAQDEIMRVIQAGNITVVDEATLPIEPSSPNVGRNTIIGFLLGAFLCMLVIFLIDFFDTRIKSEADISKIRQLPLLGVIPSIASVKMEGKKNEDSK